MTVLVSPVVPEGSRGQFNFGDLRDSPGHRDPRKSQLCGCFYAKEITSKKSL